MRLKSVLLNLFVGDMVNKPARLERKLSYEERLEQWCLKHTSIILLVCFILFGMLFALLFILLFGNTSATESGLLYNKFGGMI